MYLTLPPRLDLARSRRALAGHLARAGQVAEDAELAEIAQGFAVRLAAGRTDDSIWRELKPRIDHAGRRYTRIDYRVSRSRELDASRSARQLDFEKIDDLGVGGAQADHAAFGRGTIWVVVFWGQRLVPRARKGRWELGGPRGASRATRDGRAQHGTH